MILWFKVVISWSVFTRWSYNYHIYISYYRYKWPSCQLSSDLDQSWKTCLYGVICFHQVNCVVWKLPVAFYFWSEIPDLLHLFWLYFSSAYAAFQRPPLVPFSYNRYGPSKLPQISWTKHLSFLFFLLLPSAKHEINHCHLSIMITIHTDYSWV